MPTGNTSPDFFGGLRDGLDYYSSSVVALDAATGQVVWHFQTVHHDIWDYDVPAQPVLFDLPTPAGNVPALAQPTKQGHLFVLNRVTGEPLFPVEERPVPQTAVAGETPAPTQPFPVDEAFLLRPDRVTEDDMWGFTPWDRGKCREQFRELRHEGIFTPPSLEGTLQLPSFMGAMNWGSAAIDEARGVLVVNRNNVATTVRLIPREDADARMAEGEFMIPALKTPYARADGADAVAARRALQSPALGRARRDRPQVTQAAVGSAARHHARPRAVPASGSSSACRTSAGR